MQKVYTVTELHSKLSDYVEALFPFVWIQGEVTNLTTSSAGHLYFALKDKNTFINCVWFFSKQRHRKDFDIFTGEVLEEPQECLSNSIKNGDMLYCAGAITLYKSSHQIIIDLVQYIGEGLLHRDYMLLKIELESNGAFALERKRSLPKKISNIALITAMKGAAIQDFLAVASERGRGSKIMLYDVTVQGNSARFEVECAIKDANEKNWADIIVLIRGGGANEDLSVFNSKEVALAIFTSTLPVLAGIGHESDHSFADLIADTRAATPSQAAHLLWKTRVEESGYLFALKKKIYTVFCTLMDQHIQKLCFLSKAVFLCSPASLLLTREVLLKDLEKKLSTVLSQLLNQHLFTLEYMKKCLLKRTPYTMLSSLQEDFFSFSKILNKKFLLSIEKKEDSLNALVRNTRNIRFSYSILQRKIFLVQKLQMLYKKYQEYISFYNTLLIDLRYRIDSKNPEAFLDKGYAKLENLDGTWIHSLSDIKGRIIQIRSRNFSLLVKVEEMERDINNE